MSSAISNSARNPTNLSILPITSPTSPSQSSEAFKPPLLLMGYLAAVCWRALSAWHQAARAIVPGMTVPTAAAYLARRLELDPVAALSHRLHHPLARFNDTGSPPNGAIFFGQSWRDSRSAGP